MKKHYSLLIAFLLIYSVPIFSQNTSISDTIILQSGTQIFELKLDDKEFQRLNMHMHLQLDENCMYSSSEFISLMLENQNATFQQDKVEFARVYLPSYSKELASGNEIIYEFDMLLWQNWLRKNAHITIEMAGDSKGLKVSLSLFSEEGTPPFTVKEIIPLWKSGVDGFPYGKNGVDSDVYLPAKMVKLPQGTSAAFIDVMVSGQDKNLNDEKASSRFYFLKIDGQEIAKRSIWRDDCGLNPIFPQQQNWSEERANWCPGLRVNPLMHFLDEQLISKNELKIEMTFQKDYLENSGISAYVTSAVLFALDKPIENLNASIEEIIAPNMDLWHHRYNPICGTPIILVQNTGKDKIESITFNYGYNYQYDNKYRWKGELGFMEEELIYLPPLNWYFFDKDDEPESFTAHISAVNGEEKAFIGGKKTSVMELASVLPYRVTIELKTDSEARSNGLDIYNEDGEAYFSSGELKSDTLYQFNINFTPGCYEMIFYDETGNGVKQDAFLKIKDQKKGIILKEYKGDFGSEIREQFMIFR